MAEITTITIKDAFDAAMAAALRGDMETKDAICRMVLTELEARRRKLQLSSHLADEMRKQNGRIPFHQ